MKARSHLVHGMRSTSGKAKSTPPRRVARKTQSEPSHSVVPVPPVASAGKAKPLATGLSLTEAFVTLYDTAADEVLATLATAMHDMTPNNVHRMRVAVRRLRSGLRQFRSKKTEAAIEQRDAMLRDLANAFATVRDVDVLKTEIVPQLGSTLGLVPVNRLDDALAARRAVSAKKAVAFVASEAGKSLLKQLSDHKAAHKAFLDSGMRKITLGQHVPHQLQRAAKRLKKRCRDFSSLDVEQLHSARKAAKTLRYTFDLFAPLYPERRALEIAVNLKAMQDAFGALNDLTLTTHLDAIREAAPDDVALAHATGYLAGAMAARAEHARADARAAWKMVRSTALFRGEFRLG